jgi:hypothetical protein
MSGHDPSIPALSLRACLVSVLVMLLCAIMIQFVAVTQAWKLHLGNEPLAVPAMIMICVLTLVVAAGYGLRKIRLLSRADMFVVLFSSLIACCLMAHGLWRYTIAFSASIPKRQKWDLYDALPSAMWAHGPDLIEGIISRPDHPALTTNGNVTWRQVTYRTDAHAYAPVLSNTGPKDVSYVRLRVPVTRDDRPHLVPGRPYLISALAHAKLTGQGGYYCNVYFDEREQLGGEAFTSREEAKVTYLHQHGFVRNGMYGFVMPNSISNHIYLEFGLRGPGYVTFCETELIDVSALEDVFAGRKIVSRAEYDAAPLNQRDRLVVRPESLWSLEGLAFLVHGYFPARAWFSPAGAWVSFIILLCLALFAVAVIMRRQWIQHERFPLPVAQVPMALLGVNDDHDQPVPDIWRNRLMWAGFAVALFWCLMRGWRQFNPSVPNMNISIALAPYFTGPTWGDTWRQVSFGVTSLVLGLALFMELNVLMSLVVGFFFYRLQFWFGETYGLATDANYPYAGNQQAGSMAAYAILIVILARKYLWRVLRQAIRGGGDEVLSYRAAIILFLLSFVGIAFWARWLGYSVPGMLLVFACLVGIGLVMAKLRAECGQPHYGMTTISLLALVGLFGGLRLLGPTGLVFGSFASALIIMSIFTLAGLQLEMVEVARRIRLRRSHVLGTVALGLAGGVLLGGWVYFSSAYAISCDKYPIATGEFNQKGDFKVYNSSMATWTAEIKGDDAAQQSRDVGRAYIVGLMSAGLTVILTVLRQFFAGFWFHPVGFVLSSSAMVAQAWGSLLAAWAIRFAVLKLGGATSVRTKLMPFATGLVLGTIAAYAIFVAITLHLSFFSPSTLRFYGYF